MLIGILNIYSKIEKIFSYLECLKIILYNIINNFAELYTVEWLH